MPLALYLLALAVFAMGTSEFMLAGLVPDIAANLDVSVGTAGLLTSAFAIGMVVGAPSMAILARRWQQGDALLCCVVLFALCHVVGALSPTFAILLATRIVAALTNAGFLAVALSTAVKLVAPDQKGRALAVLLSGTTIATVAGVPAGALIGTALGWRATFWAIAVLCVPAAYGIVRSIPRRSAHDSPHSTTQPSLRAELGVLGSPKLLVAILLAALVNAGTFATFTFLAPIVTGTAALDELWVSFALVLFGLGSFVGVTMAGRLSDRRPALTIGIGSPLLVGGWVALAMLADQPTALLTLVFTQGALAFAVGSTLISRALYAAAHAPTMGGSYATAALNVGAAAGPVMGAAALTATGGDVGPVWVTVGLTGSALLIMLPLRRMITSRAPAGRR